MSMRVCVLCVYAYMDRSVNVSAETICIKFNLIISKSFIVYDPMSMSDQQLNHVR